MSEQTTPTINVDQLIGPVMMLAVFKGQDISPILDALINSKITDALIAQLAASVPEEYKDIVNVVKMAAQLDTLRGIIAAMRGEAYEPRFGLDKAVELIVTINMISALSQALGGAAGGTQG